MPVSVSVLGKGKKNTKSEQKTGTVGKGAGKKITKIIGLGKKKPSTDEQTSSAEEDVPTCGNCDLWNCKLPLMVKIYDNSSHLYVSFFLTFISVLRLSECFVKQPLAGTLVPPEGQPAAPPQGPGWPEEPHCIAAPARLRGQPRLGSEAPIRLPPAP